MPSTDHAPRRPTADKFGTKGFARAGNSRSAAMPAMLMMPITGAFSSAGGPPHVGEGIDAQHGLEGLAGLGRGRTLSPQALAENASFPEVDDATEDPAFRLIGAGAPIAAADGREFS